MDAMEGARATRAGDVAPAGCTLRMSDGRLFTDYRPRCHVQGDFYRQIGIKETPFSAYDSRMFLQNHAVDLMQKDREQAHLRLGGCVYKADFEQLATEMQTEAVVRCNPVSCTRAFTPSMDVAAPVLGDRRDYA